MMNPEQYEKPISRYCFKCQKVTKFIYCDSCGKFFCQEHAGKESDIGDYGHVYNTYSLCPRC